MRELKSCPFCGCTDLGFEQMEADEGGETNYVSCDNCLASGGYFPGNDSTSPEEAAIAWNSRVSPESGLPVQTITVNQEVIIGARRLDPGTYTFERIDRVADPAF